MIDLGALATVTADRDRLAAALAEVREAAQEVRNQIAIRHADGYLLLGLRSLDRVLAANPADLAADHDRRVRVEALRDAARRYEPDDFGGGAVRWLRAEADRIENDLDRALDETVDE